MSGNVPNTKNLSIASGVSYAEGEADGFINTATLVFDDYTVEDQAYSMFLFNDFFLSHLIMYHKSSSNRVTATLPDKV